MSTIAKKGAQRELSPAGTHIARCYKLIHLGHILDKNFQGNMVYQNKVRLYFELPFETKVFDEDKGEEPISVSKEYTLSLGDKARLRAHLESWRGKAFTQDELEGFDIEDVVGHECQVTIIHKQSKSSGNMYEDLVNITPLAKGMTCPPQINPTFIWNYNDHFDLKILENMHEWFQGIIKGSKEYKELTGSGTAAETDLDPTEEVPFPSVDQAPPEDPDGDKDQDDLPF